MKEVKLKVMEALQEEAYKGIVRIDTETMSIIGVRPGDIVEIEGVKPTVGIVDRAYPTDVGQSVIRMDGILRRNAKTGIGEIVKVRKADVKEATSITIAPAQKGVTIQADPIIFRRGLLGRAVMKGDIIVLGGARRRRRALAESPFEDIFDVFEHNFIGNFGFSGLRFIIAETQPKQSVIITENTNINVSPKAIDVLEEKVPDVTYEDIGGLDEEIRKIREMVEIPLKHPEIFTKLGIEPPKGVLLHGPPGAGKTLLARAVANESEANFILLNAPEVMNKFYGESEKKVRDIFEKAEKEAPSIIFIDEIDAIAPKREEVHGEVERRVVSQLLCLHPKTPIYLRDEIKSIENLFELTEGNIFVDDQGVINKVPKQPIYVQCLSPNGKISNNKVILLTKTNIQDAYKVKLENGSTITTSKITKFLSIDDEGVKWKNANELTKEDYIFIPRKLAPVDEIQKIDLSCLKGKNKWMLKVTDGGNLNKLFNRKYVSLQELFILENERKIPNSSIRSSLLNIIIKEKKISKDSLEKNLKISRKALNNYLRPLIKNKTISVQQQEVVLSIVPSNLFNEVLGIAYKEDGKIYPIKDKYFIKLPPLIDENLAKLLGLIVSDGHMYEYAINIAGETSIIAKNLIKILFNRDVKTQKDNHGLAYVELNSKTISKLINEVFDIPIGKKSNKVAIPNKIYKSPKSVKSAFLAGLFDGDGSISSDIRFNTTSLELAYGISRLLLSLGILSKLKRYNTYTVKVLGSFENYQLFNDHISKYIEVQRKKQRFKYLANNVRKRSSVVYPIKKRLKDIRDANNIRLDDNKYRYLSPSLTFQVNSPLLGYLLHQFENIEDQFIQEVNKIYSSEAVPCKVTSVEKVSGGVMYDLTTKYSNFLAGEIPIIVHNTKMDGLKSRGKVIVIAATNRPNSLDPALRRPGRFDREIIIGVPDKKGRLNILKIHTRNMPLTKEVKLEKLAEITHGFVGADLQALCKEAAMNVLRKLLPTINLREKESIPQEVLEKLRITDEDFKEALKLVRPSAMREVIVETPNVNWSDIGGLEDIKQELKEMVEWPLKHPDAFKRLGIKAPKGILLYGPPGTGKTLLAKAVAKESQSNFIYVKGPSLIDKFVGESEKGLRKIFEKARQVSPSIIFFDEIDALVPRRGFDSDTKVTERLVNTMLAELDGLEELNDVVIIAATNRPDLLDTALLRPGRFDRLLLVPPPDKKSRLKVLEIHTKTIPMASDVNLSKLAEKEGYVGADLDGVCREAAMLALRRNINAKEVTKEDFEEAFKKVRPTISKEAMEEYKKIVTEIKSTKVVLQKTPDYLG